MLLTDKKKLSSTFERSSKAYFEAAKVSGFKSAYPINNAVQLARVFELVSGRDFQIDEKNKPKYAKILDDLDKFIQSKAKEKKDYWDLVTDTNIQLSKILIEKKPTKKAWEELTKSYHEVWKKAGSTSDKKAELEHLDTLIKGLEFSESEGVIALKDDLKSLRDELAGKKEN